MAFDIITSTLIVLATALLLGELFERFCLPSVAGELLSGMILGPTLLGVVTTDTAISAVSSIALFFIIFHIGFEMKTQMVKGKLGGVALLSLTSFFVPLFLTVFASQVLFPFSTQDDLILALAISVPSISIVSVLVLQYDLLKTSTGQIVLSSVTVSDVIAFIILAGIVRSIERTEIIALEVGVFVVLFVLVDYLLNRRPRALKELIARASGIFRREDFAYAFLIIVGLTISVIFQAIGLTYILGAFFAGLIVHDGLIGRKPFQRVSDTLSTMNNVFFIPLFFGFAGLEVSLIGLNAIYYAELAVILILMMVVGVALTYYVSKKLLQEKHNLSPKQVAAISAGRGAIGIVIAAVALNEGILHRTGYSLVLLSTLVISLVIPFITGRVCRRPAKKRVEDLD